MPDGLMIDVRRSPHIPDKKGINLPTPMHTRAQ